MRVLDAKIIAEALLLAARGAYIDNTLDGRIDLSEPLDSVTFDGLLNLNRLAELPNEKLHEGDH